MAVNADVVNKDSNYDEKFWEEDLNEEGNRFAKAYYESTPENKGRTYLSDYDGIFSKGLPSIYHLADTWENYDLIAPVISSRFREWKKLEKGGKTKAWWRFW